VLLKVHFYLPKADKDEVKAGKAKFLPVKKTGKGPVQAGEGQRNMCQEKQLYRLNLLKSIHIFIDPTHEKKNAELLYWKSKKNF